MTFPNLARDRFVNDRPLRRTGRALLILGVVLTVFNVFLFASYLLDSADLRSRLRELRGEIAQEREAIGQTSRRLASFDLEAQNERVEFLNQRIAHRRFLWSQLFEDLGEVLPPGVRLNALSPEIGRRSGVDRSRERIPLKMVGEARDSEQLLDLVDALFAHPAFGQPKLASESRSESLLEFDLSVDYLTDRASPLEQGEGELQTTDGTGGEAELEGTAATSGESDRGSADASAESASIESPSAEPRESVSPSPPARELATRPVGAPEAGSSSRDDAAERRSMGATSSRQSPAAVQGTSPSEPRAVGSAAQPGGVPVAGASPTRSVVSSPGAGDSAIPNGAPAPRSSSPTPGSSPDPSPPQPTPRRPDASSPPGASP